MPGQQGWQQAEGEWQQAGQEEVAALAEVLAEVLHSEPQPCWEFNRSARQLTTGRDKRVDCLEVQLRIVLVDLLHREQ